MISVGRRSVSPDISFLSNDLDELTSREIDNMAFSNSRLSINHIEEDKKKFSSKNKNQITINGDSSIGTNELPILTITLSSARDFEIRQNVKNQQETMKFERKSRAIETKLYPKRFLILFLFSSCSMFNAVFWIQFAIIANITSCYYDVSLYAVNWTTNVYLVLFPPLVFPLMWLMDRKGLRLTLLLGAFCNVLSAWIQCASIASDRFPVVMVSQAIAGIGQIFIVNLPPYIAAVWFGSGEVSRACAVGVLGNQLGIAVGSLIPPLVVSNNCADKESIANGFRLIAYSMAGINTILFLVLLLVFREKPPLPPSIAEANKPEIKTNYLQSIKVIMKNLHFDLLLVAYGLIAGGYFSIAALLNQMVLAHFPGREVEVGWMGAILVFTGMIGSIVCGYILDKTHKFKETSLILYILSFVIMAAYTGLITVGGIWVDYVMCIFLGCFMAGYVPIGFEFGTEITYPESEATSAGLLNTSAMLFSIIMTMVGSYLIQNYGDFSNNLFFSACLLFGSIITACIKCNFRRRAQYNDNESTENKE